MAIEVRQITIKSLVSGDEDRERSSRPAQDMERLKEEILSECRRMLRELMRAERER